MNRQEQIARLSQQDCFDIIIIGGGATGLGCAVDSASRGYKTLLIEKFDFAKGTSSRSTKIIHGGVRYLSQGNFRLVREALIERGRLLKNAPHVCHRFPFVVPSYKWWQKWYYGFGLMCYEKMSGKLSLGKTKLLSKKETLELLPNLSDKKLNGGVLYFDGQFDDSRLAINLAQTAVEEGAIVINYFSLTNFIKEKEKIIGIEATDEITRKKFELKSKVVINATGAFADNILQLAENSIVKTIAPSQGIHLVIEKYLFKNDAAMMIPKTDDGRVLFAIPWHDKLLLGTTDTPVENISIEPKPLEEEINFIINHFNKYSSAIIDKKDIKSIFVGIRPLAKMSSKKKTSAMPRNHVVKIWSSGLVNISGGKWTTYRKMAESAVVKAVKFAKLNVSSCRTSNLKIHGWIENNEKDYLSIYGSDAKEIRKMMNDDSSLKEKIHPNYPNTKAEVKWMIRNEMAITVEDILARRLRLLFLDSKAAMDSATVIVKWMAEENGNNENWQIEQVKIFCNLASGYNFDSIKFTTS
ncbi:MAG: glycerol-3-phosphate dehydrogenase/oxidase [Bacteroidota bacterium]